MMNEPSGAKMFTAVCSNCGKNTMVPFEPAKGRPVYCEDCFDKVQSGKMQPAVGSRTRSGKPSDEFSYDLANLGIEFEFKRPPAKKMEEVPAMHQMENKKMSLSELKPQEEKAEKPRQHQNHRPKIDIEELRQAIHKSLEEDLKLKED